MERWVHAKSRWNVPTIKPKTVLWGDSSYQSKRSLLRPCPGKTSLVGLVIERGDVFRFSRSRQANRHQTSCREKRPGLVLFIQRTSQAKLFSYTKLLWERSKASSVFTLESNKHWHGAQPDRSVPEVHFVVVQTELLIMNLINYGEAPRSFSKTVYFILLCHVVILLEGGLPVSCLGYFLPP